MKIFQLEIGKIFPIYAFELRNFRRRTRTTKTKPQVWAHSQKYLPKQPEAADLDVSSGWDTKLKRRGKTCLRMGADILAPDGSIHPRSA